MGEPVHRSIRDRLLDAAAAAIVARGYRGLTMRELADAVGVSRQTVYNEFADKSGLARALVARETERTLDGIDEALARHDDIGTAVAEAVGYALRCAAENPLRKATLTGESTELLPLLTTEGEPQLFAARTRILGRVTTHWPDLAESEVAIITDVAIRLTMSHMMLPVEPVDVVAGRVALVVKRYLGV